LDVARIFFHDEIESLKREIEDANFSSYTILTDDNCEKYCQKELINLFSQFGDAQLIVVPAGDKNKNISNLEFIWNQLLNNADRHSLLINLGGGMISDLGGFAASTFKRGISFINVPTSLLAMVDASIGGKTAINFANFKNQIGSFTDAFATFIDLNFLKTLPEKELLSGFSEMLKVAIISNIDLFNLVSANEEFSKKITQDIIKQAINAKLSIVKSDPKELGKRKLLNFGHTIGHAFETYSMQNDASPISHGQAVAIGMICETQIALQLSIISPQEHYILVDVIKNFFPKYSFTINALISLISNMKTDKKNVAGKINFSLPQSVGCGLIDIYPSENIIQKSIEFYHSL